MIATYQDFMRAFLEIAQRVEGNPVKLRDVINQLADHFSLIANEREQTLPSGKQRIRDKRVNLPNQTRPARIATASAFYDHRTWASRII